MSCDCVGIMRNVICVLCKCYYRYICSRSAYVALDTSRTCNVQAGWRKFNDMEHTVNFCNKQYDLN